MSYTANISRTQQSLATDLPPHQLTRYIVDKHHMFLYRELPRLHELAERVAGAHGGDNQDLGRMLEVFIRLEEELISHMMKEERILFPAIASMAQGLAGPGPVDGPIACMLHEHAAATEAMMHLRRLSNGFDAPACACNSYRAYFEGLLALERDLLEHIHLENDVLFPAAERLARG